MTREEVIEVIKAYRDKLTHSVSNQLDGDIEAFDIAIKALEQEPTTKNDLGVDCISREHALEPYKILEDTDTLSVYTIRQNLAELPSVTPQEPKTNFLHHFEESCSRYADNS